MDGLAVAKQNTVWALERAERLEAQLAAAIADRDNAREDRNRFVLALNSVRELHANERLRADAAETALAESQRLCRTQAAILDQWQRDREILKAAEYSPPNANSRPPAEASGRGERG